MNGLKKKLADYKPNTWFVKHIDMKFDLDYQNVTVESEVEFYPSKNFADCLTLNGRELQLEFLSVNNQSLNSTGYLFENDKLKIFNLKNQPFKLKSKVIINPLDNLSLEGLYLSNNIYCTQCEAEGFRKITFFLDRPDILCTFTTTIVAHKKPNPVLLSNGNLIIKQDLPNGKHLVKWYDPIPKPCYLFALVAGDLASTKDHYLTKSNKNIELNIYTEKHNQHLCGFAMQSLKQAFLWEEQEYGREYDLDIFNIVAVDDFNSGAMENKGLNIFNSKYILVDVNSATDEDFINVKAVVGHEYFHNWTGNRITCRDWFQLSLKEGLTVFREQQFTESFYSKVAKRISDVKLLQTLQFAEDKSPLSHPVRPEQYISIRNFYTYTVYEKGAEIIRMFYNLLGKTNWRKAMDYYFDQFDGKAVTVENLVYCFEKFGEPSHTKLMVNWYKQAGTPKLSATWQYQPKISGFSLTLTQDKELLIPVKISWINSSKHTKPETLLLTSKSQKFSFSGLPKSSVPSILQEFSAPVELHADYSIEQMLELVRYDNDKFNRWYILQQLFFKLIVEEVEILPEISDLLLEIAEDQDMAWRAEMFALPSLNNLAEKMLVLDVGLLINNYFKVCQQIADKLLTILVPFVPSNDLSPTAMAQRKFNNNILWILSFGNQQGTIKTQIQTQYHGAINMTDKIAALKTSFNIKPTLSRVLLDYFYNQYQQHDLIIDKWLALQSSAIKGEVLATVKQISSKPDFQWHTPNRVFSLIGGFSQNIAKFHQSDGAGYKFVKDWVVRIDEINPQTAARLAKSFAIINKLAGKRQELLRQEITTLSKQSLSNDVLEIIEAFL